MTRSEKLQTAIGIITNVSEQIDSRESERDSYGRPGVNSNGLLKEQLKVSRAMLQEVSESLERFKEW